jgi:hypothetical protein
MKSLWIADYTFSLSSHFLSSIWKVQKNLISSLSVKTHSDDSHKFHQYGLNIERRVLDKILYEVGNSDISW